MEPEAERARGFATPQAEEPAAVVHDARTRKLITAALLLVMVPLVLVAWGDGTLDEKEREAILGAARQRGIGAERIAGELLKNGLASKPDPQLFSTWTAYARRLWGRFTADERWAMRENLLRSARQVAEATGGLFGLGSKVSTGERKVLQEIEAILD